VSDRGGHLKPCYLADSSTVELLWRVTHVNRLGYTQPLACAFFCPLQVHRLCPLCLSPRNRFGPRDTGCQLHITTMLIPIGWVVAFQFTNKQRSDGWLRLARPGSAPKVLAGLLGSLFIPLQLARTLQVIQVAFVLAGLTLYFSLYRLAFKQCSFVSAFVKSNNTTCIKHIPEWIGLHKFTCGCAV